MALARERPVAPRGPLGSTRHTTRRPPNFGACLRSRARAHPLCMHVFTCRCAARVLKHFISMPQYIKPIPPRGTFRQSASHLRTHALLMREALRRRGCENTCRHPFVSLCIAFNQTRAPIIAGKMGGKRICHVCVCVCTGVHSPGSDVFNALHARQHYRVVFIVPESIAYNRAHVCMCAN